MTYPASAAKRRANKQLACSIYQPPREKMNILHLQSLNRKLARNKLSKICFLSTITILTLTSCANSQVAKTAQMEPCSFAETVTKELEFPRALAECKYEAEKGDAVSQKNLAYMYYFGNQYMIPDKFESLKWFKMAAVQGNKQAQYRLDMVLGRTEFSQLSQ